MPTPANTFKRALSGDDPLLGLWLSLGDPLSAELCASVGFDWLLIDAEHGPHDLRSILHVLQAVAAYGAHPVVRVADSDPTSIKQTLELGATTLLVPMVESAEQARALVRAVRYPPEGVRGVGSGLARSSRWTHYDDYLSVADREVCLIVQIESVTGLQAVDEIAAVDGVDGVFVGAADLAASMGHLGRAAHPEVREAVEKGLAAIQAAGKPAGVLELDETLARRSLDLGARFVAVGADTAVLVKALQSLTQRFRARGDG